jgi:hypothetical protein
MGGWNCFSARLMADKPYTRENWNEDILQEINNLCENPDEGCDPLPPLEKVEEKHIWKKTDVREAQDKLIEICPENTFDDLKERQLWSDPELIQPLEEAIERGWCGCEEDETIYNLGTFMVQELSARTGPTQCVDHYMCGTITICNNGTWYPYVDNSSQRNSLSEQQTIIQNCSPAYFQLSREIFQLEDDIIKLQSELTMYEGMLIGAQNDLATAQNDLADLQSTRDIVCSIDPTSGACYNAEDDVIDKETMISWIEDNITEYQEKVDNKTIELNDKQVELEPKPNERLQVREDWDNAAQRCWQILKTFDIRFPTDMAPIDYFPEMFEPWGDYYEDTRRYDYSWGWKLKRTPIGHSFQYAKGGGKFSPSGYPYIYMGQGNPGVVWLDITCPRDDVTLQCHCDCFAWLKCPNGVCCGYSEGDLGQGPACYSESTNWWRETNIQEGGLLFYPLGPHCELTHYEADCGYSLELTVIHTPEYTRPPEL